MKIHVADVMNGDLLIKDVFNSNGLLVISSGTVLQPSDISKLQMHSIEDVSISPREILHRPEPQQSESYVPAPGLKKEYESALRGVESLFTQVLKEGRFDTAQADEAFTPLADHFRQEKDVVTLLLTLNNKDDYTYQHSVQVGMISYYLAKWLQLSEEDALLAGKAGYLHDIGKALIDLAILKKPGKLTPEEYEEVKLHTVYGHDIIRNSMGDSIFATVAMEHHERMDGKGYPYGKTGESLHLYSRIVAVADVYSAMISSRVYQAKRDLLTVLKELHRCSFGELDPLITHTFIQHMIPNFIGKKVQLKSGETGIIIMNNPNDYFHPLLQIGTEFIDLSKQPESEIETIYF
ncbi:HD-GYP domain-containing protein [Paenibacillus gansuensis]|uniref:HD-GYP domain-containing protein n=1 Tax=Paenibacillus gansuensis TaxID=306542 RepID=A0ABW5PFL6_9BACL